MAWSYTGNPASNDIDRLRFLIGDTVESDPILQDEELQFLITEHGANEVSLRYNAFTTVATVFAREIKRSLGPQSEDPTERLKFFRDQAAFYRAKLTIAGVSLPTYAYPKIFRKGMQSNPPWPLKKGGDYV